MTTFLVEGAMFNVILGSPVAVANLISSQQDRLEQRRVYDGLAPERCRSVPVADIGLSRVLEERVAEHARLSIRKMASPPRYTFNTRLYNPKQESLVGLHLGFKRDRSRVSRVHLHGPRDLVPYIINGHKFH